MKTIRRGWGRDEPDAQTVPFILEISMAIPGFNSQGILPPHNGNPADMDGGSPYQATSLELCETFGTTPARRNILKGYLKLRATLHELQLTEGFQWLDGRFMEKDRGRNADPEHIQVVTFYQPSDLLEDPLFAEIKNRVDDFDLSRSLYRVDHNYVNLAWELPDLISHTRHYSALLSHQSETGLWKGMLQIKLNTPQEDALALQRLEEMDRS